MDTAEWKRYVTTMCHDAWELDERATQRAMQRLHVLIENREVTDCAVADVLFRLGVSEFAAEMAAPSIRAAIVREVPLPAP